MSIREIITGVLNQHQSKAPQLEKINTELTKLYNQLGNLQQMATQANYQEKDIVDVISDMSNHLNDIQDSIQLSLKNFLVTPVLRQTHQ